MTAGSSDRSYAAAAAILQFWFIEAKPYQWFRRDQAFDQTIRKRFSRLHAAARAGRLNVWQSTPNTALARILILDQFSRNIYRDAPQAYAQDDLAVAASRDAIRRRFDKLFGKKERAFFYIPFTHSEDLKIQEESLALFKAQLPGTTNLLHARQHYNIIKRFGRFPHRNTILGRASTPEEIAFLKAGGFNP